MFNQNQIHDRPHETVPCYIYEFKDPSKASVRPTVKGRVLQSKERAIYKKVIDNLSIELGLNFYTFPDFQGLLRTLVITLLRNHKWV